MYPFSALPATRHGPLVWEIATTNRLTVPGEAFDQGMTQSSYFHFGKHWPGAYTYPVFRVVLSGGTRGQARKFA